MKYLLATNVYSNSDLLVKCVSSWPKLNDLDTAIYFDGYYYQKVFKNLFDQKILEQYVNHILKLEIPDHVGCSGGWNKLVKLCFDQLNYDYIITVGSDTILKPTFLELFIKDLEEKKPDFAVGCDTTFNCWSMNRNCYETVGLWDENFFPAYFEDGDYHCRIKLANEPIERIKMIACGEPYLFEHYGSATIKTNSKREMINSQTFVKNEQYFKKKWRVSGNFADDYKTPYNNPNLKLNEWLFQDDYKEKRKIWKDLEDSLNN